MRELLFRGKEAESGDWYYGDIFHSSVDVDTVRIHDYINRANVKIIPETLGQFAGLTDKYGTKIFEGDILRNGYDNFTAIISCLNSTNEMVAEVINGGIMDLSSLQSHRIEIIGNIYDDPELIEE